MNQPKPKTTAAAEPPKPRAKKKKKPAAKKERAPRLARPQYAASVSHASGGESQRIAPLDILANHVTDNQRWAAYDTATVVLDLNTNAKAAHLADPSTPEPIEIDPADLIARVGAQICFNAAEIEDRMESFRLLGQESDVSVSVPKTGIPTLAVGFLRHIAACVLALRGQLAGCPGFKGAKCTGLRAKIVAIPQNQTEYSLGARRNLRENLDRKELTAVDKALYAYLQLKAFDKDGNPRTKEAVAAELKMQPSSLPRYLQLWKDTPPERLRAVHEGRMAMSAALGLNHNEGRGNTRPKQKGGSKAKLRNALARKDRPRPDTPLAPNDVELLFRVYAGEEIEDLPEGVQAWAEWMQAEKAPKPRKASKLAKSAPTKLDAAPVKGDS